MLTAIADAGSEDASEGMYKRARIVRNALPTGSGSEVLLRSAYYLGRLYHVSRFLVLTKPAKRGLAQVIVRRPFGKFDLYNELGFEPDAVFHFFGSNCPLGASLFLRQIREGADVGCQWLHPGHDFAPYMVHKACANFPGIEQIVPW